MVLEQALLLLLEQLLLLLLLQGLLLLLLPLPLQPGELLLLLEHDLPLAHALLVHHARLLRHARLGLLELPPVLVDVRAVTALLFLELPQLLVEHPLLLTHFALCGLDGSLELEEVGLVLLQQLLPAQELGVLLVDLLLLGEFPLLELQLVLRQDGVLPLKEGNDGLVRLAIHRKVMVEGVTVRVNAGWRRLVRNRLRGRAARVPRWVGASSVRVVSCDSEINSALRS